MEPVPPDRPEQGITRSDLELVIRRAAELYTREAEATDHLSEAEVLRIAEELGLPRRHVHQALYELPASPTEGSRLRSWYGPPQVLGTRVVPGSPRPVLDRLEQYLVTREFLQLLRRHGHRATFAPADDTISNLARAVKRPQRHWHIARSPRVLVEVRPMPDAESHVRIDLDLSRQRERALRAGLAGGVVLGLPIAALMGVPLGAVVADVAGPLAATAAGLTTAATALAGSVAAGLAVGRARFTSRVERARTELAALLDRLESGGNLDPPAAPWLRDLRTRLRGLPGTG